MAVLTERVSLNPPAEDPTVQSLDFVGTDPSWGIYLMTHDYTPPQPESIKSTGSDVEGDVVVQTKWGNRTITAKVRVFEPSDPAAVNLVSNPSAEADLTGIARVSAEKVPVFERLVAPLETPLALNLDTAVKAKLSGTFSEIKWQNISLTAGRKYVFSVYMAASKMTATDVRLQVKKAGAFIVGGGVGQPAGRMLAAAAGTGYARLIVTVEPTETAATYELALVQETAGETELLATAAMTEEGTGATHYFDGDTPGCDWSAARNLSTSSRPAPDGTRFSRICRDVTRQMDRLRRTKQGVLRRISAQGGPMYFDLRVGQFTEAPTALDISRKRAEYGMSFEALSGGRTPEQLIATKEELTLPVLSVLLENVPGEMAALGRLVLTDKQGFNQRTAWWGLEQTYFSAAASAEPYYEAETRTLLGGTVVEGTPAGASGNKVVKSNALLPEAQSIFSTQATGGGAQLSHAGGFRLLARVQIPATNTGATTIGLNYASGDFINTQESGSATLSTSKGKWQVIDLGVLNIPQAASGTAQRWEGRFTAKSTVAGDVVYFDGFVLVPTTDGAAKATGLSVVPGLPPVVGYDDFPTTGALSGKAARVGGNWSGAGSATDFTVEEAVGGVTGETTPMAIRKAVSDAANAGRYELLGAAESEAVELSWNFGVQQNTAPVGFEGGNFGMFARYLNVENWLAFVIGGFVSGPGETVFGQMLIRKRVAGVVSTPASLPLLFAIPVGIGQAYYPFKCSAYALADGTAYFSAYDLKRSEPRTILISDTDLVAGTGALKKGKAGLFDEHTSSRAVNRSYDNVRVTAPLSDAAMYANKGLEVRSDRARRESSDGLTFGSLGAYEGDYLMIPPAGPEKRVSRLVAKASRNPVSDDGIDDLKAQVYVTPRYLHAAPY